MNRQRTIGWIALAISLAVMAPSVARCASPTSRAAHLADNEAEANVRAAAPPAANRSPLDSERIHRGANSPGGAAPSTVVQPRGMELPRVAMSLSVVIALIFALRWGGKKIFQQPVAGRSTRAVQILARTPLAPRQQVLLLRVGRRVIVVGDSGSQMHALSEITDPDEVAALIGQLREETPEFSVKAFGSVFSRARHEMSHEADEPPETPSDTETPEATDTPDDPAISDTRLEITGLMEKVRVLSRHYRES